MTSPQGVKYALLDRMKNTVRELRSARGMSQGQLGEALRVSRQTINAIETERYTPSLPLALELARFFGTSVEDMFDVDGDRKSA